MTQPVQNPGGSLELTQWQRAVPRILICVAAFAVLVAICVFAWSPNRIEALGSSATWAAIAAALLGTTVALSAYRHSQAQYTLAANALKHSIEISNRAERNRVEDKMQANREALNFAVTEFLGSVTEFADIVNSLNGGLRQIPSPAGNDDEAGKMRLRESLEAMIRRGERLADCYTTRLVPRYWHAYLAAKAVSNRYDDTITDVYDLLSPIGDRITEAVRGVDPTSFDLNLAKAALAQVQSALELKQGLHRFPEVWRHLERLNSLPLSELPEVVPGWFTDPATQDPYFRGGNPNDVPADPST
ncbi:hypothetical protein [Tsukamurella tyrosinosolvens]|uniref:hypothetical protein n=1 Tax=Tsukamurella tyrosinosolvens TaxID=57704 RepID=UPI002DD43278|nr:hypothetical protein [Tsukamurella tyrosinosolvens]MEC4614576.1 hypothetical protein [Tsukamurella tyrosinosolvens]